MKTKLPSLVSILVLSILTAVMWISFSVYRSLTTKPEPTVKREISESLNPTLDTETIQEINTSIYVEN